MEPFEAKPWVDLDGRKPKIGEPVYYVAPQRASATPQAPGDRPVGIALYVRKMKPRGARRASWMVAVGTPVMDVVGEGVDAIGKLVDPKKWPKGTTLTVKYVH